MRFVVVRSNAPGCEPTCPEWISAEGAISANAGFVQRCPKTLGRRKLPIVADSPGGDVEAAPDAWTGLIRKNKLDIAIGKTRFDGCLPDGTGCVGT